MAISRHQTAVAANRGFMITVSIGPDCITKQTPTIFGVTIWTSNGGSVGHSYFQGKCCLNATRFLNPIWTRRELRGHTRDDGIPGVRLAFAEQSRSRIPGARRAIEQPA